MEQTEGGGSYSSRSSNYCPKAGLTNDCYYHKLESLYPYVKCTQVAVSKHLPSPRSKVSSQKSQWRLTEFFLEKSEERVPALNRYQQHHKGLCMELIKILNLNTTSVILVSLRHLKVSVSLKRFQSVLPKAFIFSKNNPQYSHTYTEMHFSLALSLATSQELEQNPCVSDVAAATGLVSSLQSCWFTAVPLSCQYLKTAEEELSLII